jgi:hypothetical protein
MLRKGLIRAAKTLLYRIAVSFQTIGTLKTDRLKAVAKSLAVLLLEFCVARLHTWIIFTSGKPGVLAAQRIGGGRKSTLRIYFWSLLRKLHTLIHGSPAKPSFRCLRRKCAQR